MEILDRHGIRATVALNSDICIHHPDIIEEGETTTRAIPAASMKCILEIHRSHVSAFEGSTGNLPTVDTLYREGATSGRGIHIAVHPYLTGCRIASARSMRRSSTSASKKATGAEIARYYRAHSNGQTRSAKKPARNN